MGEQKQELLKLIHDLDWDKINEIVPCGFMNTSRMPRFKILKGFLKTHQKEKSIEKNLEELGFYYNEFHKKYCLCYYSTESTITINYCDNDYSFNSVFDKKAIKLILNFANYLINIKNRGIE